MARSSVPPSHKTSHQIHWVSRHFLAVVHTDVPSTAISVLDDLFTMRQKEVFEKSLYIHCVFESISAWAPDSQD